MDNQRLQRVRANMEERGISQMLLVDPLSIWWLCGYYTEPLERFLGLLPAPRGRAGALRQPACSPTPPAAGRAW